MTVIDLPALRSRLSEKRQETIDRFRANEQPEALLEDLRRACDQTLRDLVKQCPLPPGATLAAVGGYGRGELYP